MNKNIDVIVTVEYKVKNFIDERTLKEEFDNDLLKAYKSISEDKNEKLINIKRSEK